MPPTSRDIDELLVFQDAIGATDFEPIEHWAGVSGNSEGACAMPWPSYNDTVEAFFATASKDCWSDFDYDPESAGAMLRDPSVVSGATLEQIKTMLTFCVRGERFSDGHWGAMVEEGGIGRLLDRLRVIRGL